MIVLGEKYIVQDTVRNATNHLIAGKEARVAHISDTAISVRVFQNGSEKKLLVPLDLFGVNFERELSFVPPNKGYISPLPFIDPYI